MTGNISTRRNSFAQAGVDNLVSAARTLRAPGKVIVIGDPEGLEQSPVDCLLSRHASMATCSTTWPSETLEVSNEVARRAKEAGAGFLGTRQLLCYQRTCPAVIGHTIAWADNNHVSGTYSAWVAPAFPSGLPAGGGKRKPLTPAAAGGSIPPQSQRWCRCPRLIMLPRVESRRLGAVGRTRRSSRSLSSLR